MSHANVGNHPRAIDSPAAPLTCGRSSNICINTHMHDRVKIIPNVLTREQCSEIIANAKEWEQDFLKADIAPQSEYFDKETLDKNTIERTLDYTYRLRKVCQSSVNPPVFPEWDGHAVYRCKVMRYNKHDFLAEHHDARWMCLSNYWAPGTNKISQSLISIALNDDYEGGDFTVEGEIIPQEVGSAIQVPQHALDRENNLMHGVREVTAGTRYSLVFWNFA